MLRFSDGEEFNTDGEYRLEERFDGWYVLGHGIMIPVEDRQAGEAVIANMDK